jgi:UDP-2-acetamido-2,6-beta-L-arabino-hexul-4-ose reductase
MKVLLTGAAGFLGWHTRARLHATTDHETVPVTRSTWPDLDRLVADADAVIHVAGVNRGPGGEVRDGNIALAEQLAAAVRSSGARPRIVFANSVQCGNLSPYGEGKAGAAAVLAGLAAELGTPAVDIRLPNLFGEHGRPRYNSFVPTFVEAVLEGRTPSIEDRPIELMHAQQAAQVLIDALQGAPGVLAPRGTPTTVRAVFNTLVGFRRLYSSGDIPALSSDLDVDLFNTLRSALFPAHYPIPLGARSDSRGSLIEVVRAHGGQGQTFVSSTRPGMTRGEHFHLRKIERFVVLAGQATITLRRLFSSETVTFDVSGVRPCIVDMPTLWAHNIANTGSSHLSTLFWTHELFDPGRPDTYPEPVAVAPRELVDAGAAR